jgi:hypothetical protein
MPTPTEISINAHPLQTETQWQKAVRHAVIRRTGHNFFEMVRPFVEAGMSAPRSPSLIRTHGSGAISPQQREIARAELQRLITTLQHYAVEGGLSPTDVPTLFADYTHYYGGEACELVVICRRMGMGA